MDALIQEDPFADIKIPEQLQESLQRHREELARLVTNLQSVGLSDVQIRASISVIVDSYKEELFRAIKVMVR